ncbi:sugar O-acetyltransferase [Magnetospira sp. QH-2]|uniref:sugar O-acetyltransferase n=1 Tax=Magnetospira sp. (strain QH-2) TaxID=1288970 RepID=UPI0003E811E9|nr:sugar O-acetyltransferase [Magnetospira sp. QH-2]CCQ75114.1 acetyltransferase [Magnetospira sp. QH-2]
MRPTGTISELSKMLGGDLYDASDPELVALRLRARRLTRAYNLSEPDAIDERRLLLNELLGVMGEGTWIEPPFHCDYGSQISLGRGVYMNFNCIILDCNHVRIGDQTQLGPNVTLSAATHPLDAEQRVAGPELAYPITIGNRAWIGAGAIIGPGVTIGEDTTIGAGSVVMKDVPPGVVAAGNPCRVIRGL